MLLERTAHPGVCHRGTQYVAVYRRDGPAQGVRRHVRRGTSDQARTRFPADERLADFDRRALQGFIGWLTDRPGRRGRLSDSSIRNALTPLRRCLDAAAHEGLIDSELARSLVLPSRRASQRRSLCAGATWTSTWSPPRWWVRRAIVRGIAGAPKSYYGARAIPLAEELAGRLCALRPADAEDEDLVFPSHRGRPINPSNLRNRVLKPAAKRAGVPEIGLHALRHTCASLLIEERTSSLRLQRWMGHHAAAYTLETYGHLINDELGKALELEDLGVRDRGM